jgi:hypothetical protein
LIGVHPGVSKTTSLVDASGEEVMEEALLGLFELGDEPLGRPNRLICRVQDLRDYTLFGNWRQLHAQPIGIVPIESRDARRRVKPLQGKGGKKPVSPTSID